jgi:repressor LexA
MSPSALSEKEKAILDYIKEHLRAHGHSPSYSEIREALGYKSTGSIHSFIKQLERKNHLSTSGGKHYALKLRGESERVDAVRLRLSGTVAAGLPIETIENQEEFIDVSKSLLARSGEHFALKVKGQSMMEEGILNGDTVVIRSQSHAENGQTVVAVIDNEATIKKYYKKKGLIELHPANPEFHIRAVKSSESFHIKGILVGVIRRLG